MLLRMLREPTNGGPGPFARLVALVVVIGMVGVSAPVLVPVVGWVIGLL